MDEEKHLVEMAKNGDNDAFMSLYKIHFEPVYRFIYYKVGNEMEAEDIAQETFLKAYKAIHGFKGDAKFKSWLIQIAKYTIADYFRHKYKHPTIAIEDYLASDPFPYPEDDEEKEEILKNQTQKELYLQNILSKLPEKYRNVIQCRFLENLNLEETAQKLSLTVSNVKILQYRGLKKLQQLCADNNLTWT